MKRKGFTLIELLAVIIVLAIIALILVPTVTNTIKNAEKGSAEIATQNYIRAVDITLSNSELNKKTIPDGKYKIDEDGNLIGDKLPGGKLVIDAKGDKPTSGTIVIKNGEVSTDAIYIIGDYKVMYNPVIKSYEATEKEGASSGELYLNGEVVYFNVTTGEKCSNYTETQSNTGTKSGCMKFYAFNDDGKDTVNLILDHNTTAEVAWISKEDYIASGGEDLSNVAACQYGRRCATTKFGPGTLLTQLKNDTEAWKGTETPSNYTMDQTGQTSNAKYTIDYSSYKARLITAQEIAQITRNTKWDEKTASSSYYFDSKSTTESDTCRFIAQNNESVISGCNYGWLYDRTSKDCALFGCLNNSDQKTDGYWTASSRADDSNNAWIVYFGGSLSNLIVASVDYSGVRPVITVLKSKLN